MSARRDLISYDTLAAIERRVEDLGPGTTLTTLRSDVRVLLAAVHEMRARLVAVDMAARGRLTGTHAAGIVDAEIERERIWGDQ